MKQVGIKLISKHYHKYYYYFTVDAVESQLYVRCRDLKPGQTIVVKLGRKHCYIVYDYNEHDDTAYISDIGFVMYCVRDYLN